MPITSQTIFERADYEIGVAVQDVSTADVSGDYFSMSGIGRVASVVVTDALAVGDAVTVQLLQATDDEGAGSKVLGDAVTVTAAAAGAAKLEVEAMASGLDIANGFSHVAVQISATPAGATTINAGATLIKGDTSYRS